MALKTTRIGSLKVKSFGSGSSRVKVVLFPGHEYGIEHFLPQNLKIPPYYFASSQRTRFVDSIGGTRFIAKCLRSPSTRQRLTAISEAKLARFINSLSIPMLKIEEPLAVLFRSGGHREVIYHIIEPKSNSLPDSTTRWIYILKRLYQHGISPGWDAGHNVIEDKNGFHIFDLEEWNVTDQLRRKLRLKLASANEET